MKRHMREDYYIVGEGLLAFDGKAEPTTLRASTTAELRKFRFSRLGPKGRPLDEALRIALAEAMTTGVQADSADPSVPAGFTYLGQFVDHDLTMDRTAARSARTSPSTSCCRAGRRRSTSTRCTAVARPTATTAGSTPTTGCTLKSGTTARGADPTTATNVDLDGFDLPRAGLGVEGRPREAAADPGSAQRREPRGGADPPGVHPLPQPVSSTSWPLNGLAGPALFARGAGEGRPALPVDAAAPTSCRGSWIRTIVDDVFTNGRRFFEVSPGTTAAPASRVKPGDRPTMPIEFSVAAYRLGHSMVRERLRVEPHVQLAVGARRCRPARWTCCSGSPATSGQLRPPGGRPRRPGVGRRSNGCRPTGSPTSGGCTTSVRPAGPTSSSGRAQGRVST